MSIRPTIILLVLAVIGVAAMWWSMTRNAQEGLGRVQQTGGQPLLDAVLDTRAHPLEDVHRIAIERSNGTRLLFAREGVQWRQVEPFAYPMDAYSMRQLIVLAGQLRVSERLDAERAGLTPATMGFNPPDAIVRYTWPDGHALALDLGRRGVAGRAYLRVGGSSEIAVVNNDLHDRVLDMDPKEWRERGLFLNVSVDAERFERTEGTSRVVLAREGRVWTMLEPARTRIDPQAVEALFTAAGKATASGFILDQPTDLARFGLEPPMASVTITMRSAPVVGTAAPAESVDAAEQQKLLVGARLSASTPDRFGYVEGRESILSIPGPALQALFMPATALAQPTGCGVNPADVKSLVIRAGENELTLERDIDRWVATDRDRAQVEAPLVQELLEQLARLRASSVEFKPYPRELEIATITLYGFDARAMTTVRIAKEADNGRIAMDNGDDVLRIFPASLELRLTAEQFGLR